MRDMSVSFSFCLNYKIISLWVILSQYAKRISVPKPHIGEPDATKRRFWSFYRKSIVLCYGRISVCGECCLGGNCHRVKVYSQLADVGRVPEEKRPFILDQDDGSLACSYA